MGHVGDTGETFAQRASVLRPDAVVRFSADQIEWLCAAGLLDPDARFELIDGQVVDMAPDRSPHATAKSVITRWLGRRLGDDVHVGAEVTLKAAASTILAPDIVVWRPVTTDGFLPATSATLVVEVAAQDVRSDLAKVGAYAAAGVPTVWVVDLGARVTWVHRIPAGQRYLDTYQVTFADPIAVDVAVGVSLVMDTIIDLN